ncbi:hypothetical protein NLO413_0321 [Candidatus Neoehrlichia lotoris str. RAC413]|uniref:Uncharacterized protein n=1 Tax=Candidatus Neoehrlichia procyonis str. RAC413 TaxID=1359163 RepID=A0A0F3NPV1_9RICK|nr:hypothetical protein NLO413_0321 [Candidatus Neoehrlichia lotoris str. RAC413]
MDNEVGKRIICNSERFFTIYSTDIKNLICKSMLLNICLMQLWHLLFSCNTIYQLRQYFF